ncbi:proline dehydrogenase [Vermiconidia calcicola]|uniref:Proline dehydrogenase n=1 Tax=Vermiconidia calcicola TaxID=1690605 RepID=A0ACC3N7C9_9PEZI|nr:proline dehydrogenase [Vermiconidia calcicola]
MAVKLVRGAYIGSDPREAIHDTKKDTDDNYNGIVRDVLTGSNLGRSSDGQLPKTELFVAGHNPNSVAAAMNLVQSLREQGKLKTTPDFGQLQGMADELGCSVVQKCSDLKRKTYKTACSSLSDEL